MSESKPPVMYDLVLQEEEFCTRDKNGIVEEWVLREMTGEMRDKFMNVMQSKMRPTPDGKSQTIRDFNGIQSLLLTRCIFRKSDGNSIKEEVVQSWPTSMQSKIYKRAQEINGLDDLAEERAKKD